ncbi:MAG: hypothetical protein ACKN98_05780, partial [Candidatus Limnocylindrus sp.]
QISSSFHAMNDRRNADNFNSLPIFAGRATWMPTFSHKDFCPGWVPYTGATTYTDSCTTEPDINWLVQQHPWNYTMYGRAMEFITAFFGVDWVQQWFFKTLAVEFQGQDKATFNLVHDKVARRMWGGKWSDLVERLDQYLLKELKRGGVTGLE